VANRREAPALIRFSTAEGAIGSLGDRYGHSYFRDAPSVASDVVLTLRDDLDPGVPGRPLTPLGHHLWSVPPSYLTPKPVR
jgi:hypothetical protein